jgi:hypothetical protein
VHHGRLVGGPSESFHTATHHYCYPEKGIEADLGPLAVLECNRWWPNAPGIPDDRSRRDQGILLFRESAAGKRYQGELDAWRQALELEERAQHEAEEEAQRLVAELDAAEIGGEA